MDEVRLRLAALKRAEDALRGASLWLARGWEVYETPWTCRYHEYRCVDHHMVPMYGEVEWSLEAGRFAYCRIRLQDVDYALS